MELYSVLFPACCVVKMAWISTSVLFYAYSKLYILTELSANDVKITSVDRQKLDLSIYIYTYGTVNSIFIEIQPDSTNIKNDSRTWAATGENLFSGFYDKVRFKPVCLTPQTS